MKNKIMEKISGVCMKAALKKREMASALKERKEAGFSTIVIIVFLILIGVAVCLVFKDQILAFLSNVINKLDGAADTMF